VALKPRTHDKRSERFTSTAGRRLSAANRCGMFVVDPESVRRGREAVLGGSVVKIIRALAGGKPCVCEISEVLGLSVSATLHQLQLLRNLRLVRVRSEGKLAYSALSDPFLVALLHDCPCYVQRKEPAGMNGSSYPKNTPLR